MIVRAIVGWRRGDRPQDRKPACWDSLARFRVLLRVYQPLAIGSKEDDQHSEQDRLNESPGAN